MQDAVGEHFDFYRLLSLYFCLKLFPFLNIRRFSGPFYAIFANITTILCLHLHLANIFVILLYYIILILFLFFCSKKIKLFLSKKGYRKTFSQTFECPQQCKMLWVNILILSTQRFQQVFGLFFYILDFREHYDNIVSGQHVPTPV